jgi:hypothetical protein
MFGFDAIVCRPSSAFNNGLGLNSSPRRHIANHGEPCHAEPKQFWPVRQLSQMRSGRPGRGGWRFPARPATDKLQG